MKRTTIYLNDEEREGLRRLSAASGKSQAALIRGAIRRILAGPVKRQFHSMGKGLSDGTSTNRSPADAQALYRRKMGL